MAKMQDKRWQRLQTLATAFRETGDTQSVKLLYEEIHPYIWAAVRGSRYGVVDDASQDWCSQIRCDVFRLLKSPSWHPRRQPFATMLTRVTTNSLHTMWQRVRYSNERVNHEALSIDWMNELLGDAWEREVLEAVPHNSRYDQVTDRFVVHTLRRVSDRATRQTIDAVLRQETIADAAKYLQVTPTCVRRRLRQLGKDMACVEQILDPWPVVFQEAVLEGNVTLHCPSPPFYAAVPIQRQTSSQWGLSVGGQVRRENTRTIHVKVLEEAR